MSEIKELVVKYHKNNTEALTKIMKGLEPLEQATKDARKLCFTLDPNNMDRINELQIRIVGHKSQLQELFSKVDSLKRNKELAAYMDLKIKSEESEGTIKFVDGSSKMEAAFAVADERRVRDHIEGLLKSADDILKTCRNLNNGQQADKADSSLDQETTS